MWYCKIFVSQSNKIAFPISARHNAEVRHIYSCYARSKYLKQTIGMDTLKISKTIDLLIIKNKLHEQDKSERLTSDSGKVLKFVDHGLTKRLFFILNKEHDEIGQSSEVFLVMSQKLKFCYYKI